LTLDEHNMAPNGLLAPDEIARLLDIAHSTLREVAEANQPKRSHILRLLDELETRRTTLGAGR
jgi:hypothetical protein